MSWYREQLEEYLKGLDVQAYSVLDVGGSQLPIKKRVHSFQAVTYEIADLPAPHKGEKPDIEIDLNIITHLPRQYDVVFCLEVMEYIWNPFTAIQNLRNYTVYGGKLYITFPFLYPVHNPVFDDMLRYTENGARTLLHKNDFAITKVIPRTIRNCYPLMDAYKQDGMRAASVDQCHSGVIIEATAL